MTLLIQKEVIEKLNAWITDEGKPAIAKADQHQMEKEKVQNELDKAKLELDAMKKEVVALSEEKRALEEDNNNMNNHKRILSEKLKNTEEDLAKAEASLEEYYDKDANFNTLQSQVETLKTENETLTKENAIILERNEKFVEKNNSLQEQLNKSTQFAEGLQASSEADQEVMKNVQHKLDEVMEQLNQKDEEIFDLREKLGLKADSDTYRPIASSMKQTIRMDDANFRTITERTDYITERKENNFSLGSDTLSGFGSHVQTLTDSTHFAVQESLRMNPSTDFGGFHMDVVEETIPKEPMGDLDTIQGRITSQSVTERHHDLQGQVFEYQVKEKHWMEDKQRLEKEKDDLQADSARLTMELVQKRTEIANLNKQFEEEREANAAHIQEMLQLQYPDQELILGDKKKSGVNKGVSEDESSPLMSGGDRNRNDPISKRVSDDPPGCVCFSFRVW